MSVDWQALEENFNNFKPLAPEGEYEAEIEKVEIKQNNESGSIAVRFIFKNGEYSYPWASHWWSNNNRNWSYWHHSQILQMLGVRKEDAQTAIGQLDDIKDNTTLIKRLTQMYEKAIQKKKLHKIVVRETYDQQGNVRYSDKGYKQLESEFLDPKVFISNKPKDPNPKSAVEPEPSADEEEIDLGDIPF